MWLASIDGPIEVPANWDAGGNPTAWRPEYHLNVPKPIFDARPELAAYRVTPASPQRIYCMDLPVTVFLRFPSEAAAKSILQDFWMENDPS